MTLVAVLDLEFNRTGLAVNTNIGGVILDLEAGAGPYFRVAGSAVLDIAGFVSIAGDFAAEQTTTDGPDGIAGNDDDDTLLLGASNISTRLGVPGGVAVSVSNAAFGFVGFADGTYALLATGDVALQGVDGLTLAGNVSVLANNTLHTGSQVVPTGIASNITVDFSAGELLQLSGMGLLLSTPLGTVSGDFTFTRDGATGDIDVTGSNVDIFVGFGDPAAPLDGALGLAIDNGNFALLLLANGSFALFLEGGVQFVDEANVAPAGTVFTGMFEVAINTTGVDQDLSLALVRAGVSRVGGSLTVTVQVGGAGVDLSGDFAIEIRASGADGILGNADDADELLFAATGVNIFVGYADGGLSNDQRVGIEVNEGELVLVLANLGLALEASGEAAIVGLPGVLISGAFGVQLNTTGSAITRQIEVAGVVKAIALADGVERFGGNDVTLSIAGQSLSGSFAVEIDDALNEITIGIAGVDFAIGDGSRDFLGVSNANGIVLISDDGIAAAFDGIAFVDIQGVALSAPLVVEINQTGNAIINRSITVGSETQTLDFSNGDDVIRIRAGTSIAPVSLTIANQSLQGVFLFEQQLRIEAATTLSANALSGDTVLAVGDVADFVVGASVFVSLADGSEHRSTIAVGGVGVGSLTLVDALPGAAVTGSDVRAGEQVLKVGLSEVGINIGGGAVVVSGGIGVFVVTAQGVAGEIAAAVNLGMVPGIDFNAAFGAKVTVNTTASQVTESFVFSGPTIVDLDLPPGPYLRVEIGGAAEITDPASFRFDLDGGTTFVDVTGNLLFEQITRSDGSTITRIGVTNFSATVDGNGVTNGEGALVLVNGGLAGILSGEAALEVGPVSAGGTVTVRINTTGGAVSEAVTIGGREIIVEFGAAEGNVFSISVSDLSLNSNDFVTIEGDIAFSSAAAATQVRVAGSAIQTTLAVDSTVGFAAGSVLNIALDGGGFHVTTVAVGGVNAGALTLELDSALPGAVAVGNAVTLAERSFAGQNLEVFLGEGPARLESGDINPLAMGLLLSDASIGVVEVQTGADTSYAVFATGTLQVIGVSGFSVLGTATVRFNDTGVRFDRILTIAGSDRDVVVRFDDVTDVASLQAVDLAIDVLGQQLRGDFAFSKVVDVNGVLQSLNVAATNVSLNLADGVVLVEQGDGQDAAFVITPQGLAGQVSATVSVNLPSVSFTGAFTVAINSTGVAVDQSIPVGAGTVDLLLPAGPFLRIEGTGVSLNVLGQSLGGNFAIEQVTEADGTTLTRIAASAVTLELGPEVTTDNHVLELNNGAGAFLLTSAGIAGRLSGTVTINAPGIVAGADFTLAINTLEVAVAEQFRVNGEDVTLDLAAGPYLRVEALNTIIVVGGQSIAGDFVIERSATLDGGE